MNALATSCDPSEAEKARWTDVARGAVGRAGMDVDVHVVSGPSALSVLAPDSEGWAGPIQKMLAPWSTNSAIAAAAVEVADLHLLAEARAAAIRKVGGDPANAPAWSFMANPIARALLDAGGLDLAAHAPTSPDGQGRMTWTSNVTGWRVGYMALHLPSSGISIDAANGMARILLAGDFPETVVQGIVGRPVRDVIDLPWLREGDHGLSPVRDAWSEDGRMGLTVRCGLAPLADAPEGVDTSWLAAWLMRHAG